MSFVCSICQDCLTERPQALNNDNELILCALNCGHLFHRVCVRQWFGGNGASGNGQGTCPSCKVVSALTQSLRIFPTGDEDSNAVDEHNKSLHSLIQDNQNLETELRDAKNELGETKEENQMLHSDIERAVEKLTDLKMKFEEENQSLESQVKELKSEINELQSAFEDEKQVLRTDLDKVKEELSNMKSSYDAECAAHDNLRMEQGELLSTLDMHNDQFVESREMKTAMENSVKTAVERTEKEKKLAMQLLARYEKKNKALLEEMEALLKRGKSEHELFFDAAAAHGLECLDTDTEANSENISSLIESLFLLQEDEDA